MTTSNKAQKENFTEDEINLICSVYNQNQTESVIATPKNYQYIFPAYLKEILQNFLTNKNASQLGKEIATNILNKLS